jgi:hypothetical protein
MMTPRVRVTCLLLLLILLGDSLLGACTPADSVRRTQEDAWLLLLAGEVQLTGALPEIASASAPHPARVAIPAPGSQSPTTPNEAWNLMDYYSGLREAFEQKAKADGLPPEVIQAGLAEYDAKIKALADRAQELGARRARRRGTAWKRFFDGMGRFVGKAFDVGGKIVKFAIEDVPSGVVEYGPDLIREYARAYVEKLKGQLRNRGEQKAFEILAEKNPNLAAAYLMFKAGRAGVKLFRDFARLFGRHPRQGASVSGTGPEQAPLSTGGDEQEAPFTLPSGGQWTASCDSGRDDDIESWCAEQGGSLTADSEFQLRIDFASGTFSLAAKTECEGPKFTNSSGGWTQITNSEELKGGGTLYPDGWLVGMVEASAKWMGRGVRLKASGSESYEEGGPTEATVPLIARIETQDDMQALELFFTSGAAGENPPVDVEWLRGLGWEGVEDWLGVCKACYVVCRPGGGS